MSHIIGYTQCNIRCMPCKDTSMKLMICNLLAICNCQYVSIGHMAEENTDIILPYLNLLPYQSCFWGDLG